MKTHSKNLLLFKKTSIVELSKSEAGKILGGTLQPGSDPIKTTVATSRTFTYPTGITSVTSMHTSSFPAP